MDMRQYADAIASIESAGSGGYSAIGPRTRKGNRAYGRYQVMDFNIGPWTEKYLGQRLTPERFLANPEAQDAVFQGEFGNYVQRYGNPQDAASAWFTGRPLSEGAGRSDILGTTGTGYVNKFNAALGAGGNMQRPTGLLGTPTVSTQGQAPAPQEEERKPFFQRPGVGNFFDTLAMGLEGMTLNPNQGLIKGAQNRIQQRRETAQTKQQRNRTADWLESQGMGDLAQGVRSGALGARDALTLARGQQQDPYSSIGKLQADLAAGRISQEQYEVALQSMAPSGMAIEVGPDGQVRVSQGPGAQAKPFTEGQSKDVVYATRAEGALQVLDPVADNLADAASRAANVDPTGFIRSRLQSPEFQVAQQAGNEFLQAILRKDTGAAITEQEQQLYGQTYLPQPGDSPEVLREKKAARRRALDAIRGGMSPSQIIAVERNVAGQDGGPTSAPQVGDVVEGFRFMGGDPANQNNWQKVQ